MLKPSQPVNVLFSDLSGSKEVSKITASAEDAQFSVQNITYLAFASITQADYVVIVNKAGTKYGVWLDKDNNGTAPTGAAYVATDSQIEVDISTGDTAAQVATKVYNALNGNLTNITVTNPSAGVVKITQTKVGPVTAAAPHNENDSGAGSIVVANVTTGVASSLQNKYFTFKSGANASFFCWFNCNSEGSNPAPGGTAISCALTDNMTATQVASAIASAVNANANFNATSDGVYVNMINEAFGICTDVGAGNSGFTVEVLIEGSVQGISGSSSPASLTNEPSLIAAS